MSEFEVLREVWRVTEYKDGAVYKTEYVEDRWLDMDEAKHPPKGTLYVPLSDWTKQSIRTKRK